MRKIDVLEINSVNFGSTGGIMKNIADLANKSGVNTLMAYPLQRNNYKNHREEDIYIGSRLLRNSHLLLAKLTGLNGCFSVFSTINFIIKIHKLKLKIIHIHNLHNCYINLPLLFTYIKCAKIAVIWTLHDCWSFTGQCPYFTISKCEKWKTGCYACNQYKQYPSAFVDMTKLMWKLKKKWFSGVDKMVLITPSNWLKDLVEVSFLKHYPIKVLNNGIDLSVYFPRVSNLKTKLNIEENKFVVLGVSSYWSKRKGFDVFIEMRKRLTSDYVMILVGTNSAIRSELPQGIIGIDRTADQKELAELYSLADVFVNPTREENYPTVNMEAIACGTPVITFNTGGSPEILTPNTGVIVDCDDIDALISTIENVRNKKINFNISSEEINLFNKDIRLQQYVSLYKELLDKKSINSCIE